MYVQRFERDGFVVYENVSDKFEGTTYFSIVNPKKRMKNDPNHKAHVHVDDYQAAIDVIDYVCKRMSKEKQKRIGQYIKSKARQLVSGIPYYRMY